MNDERGTLKGERGTMKKTRLSSVASLLATGVLMGGCMADVGAESESEAVAAQGPNVGGGEALGAAQQALSNGRRFNALGEPSGPARADLQVWRSSSSIWYAQRTSDGYGFGWALSRPVQPQDVPVSMNIDGDTLADEVTFRPSDGTWYYRLSSTGQQGQVVWGTAGDIPTPGDFDGDGKTDFAIWRPSTGVFWIAYASGGTYARGWGGLGDIPVVGNYDGDNRDDLAVFRPSNGGWYHIRSSDGTPIGHAWGTVGDIPVAGDFDGDGKTDLTVFRPASGFWYTVYSSGRPATGLQYGATCDVPLPADYDGDGKTDIGVRRMEAAINYFINSSTGAGVGTGYGLTTDVPANASTFCYINGALGPCRASICGPVGGIRRTAPVAGSYGQGVAVKSDGTVWVVGTTPAGTLGSEQVQNLTDVVAVTSGYSGINLALKSDGTVWSWRYTSTPATRVEGLTDVVAVEVGDHHALALKKDGTLWAWGGNSQGQLGDGTKTDSPTPKQIMTDVVSVSAGESHTLAAKSDGTVWSWGKNFYRQLGYATYVFPNSYGFDPNPTPRQVPNLTGIVQVSAAWEHSAALKRDGTVWTWGGDRFNQLGYPTPNGDYHETPTQIPGLTGVVSIDTGYYATYQLALKADGTLWNWNSRRPGTVMEGVVAMSGGYGRALAVKNDGTLWTWTMTNATQELVATVPVKL